MQKVRRAGYFLILIVGVALTTAFVWRPTPPERFTGLQSLAIPTVVGSFSGRDVPVDSVTKNALVSAAVTAREFHNAEGQVVYMTIIGGTDRSALHDPRSCLVGAGWRIDRDRVESLNEDGRLVPARTCTAQITDPISGAVTGYDILYLYVTHRRVIASATQIRFALLESALLEQNDAPVYFIRLMSPLGSGSDSMQEHSYLKTFATEFWKQLEPSIMRGEHG